MEWLTRTVLLLSIVGMLSDSTAFGQNASAKQKDHWASFRNGTALRGLATTDLPQDLEILWTHETKDGVPSTAAIVDGRVYVGALDGLVFCFDRASGEMIWQYRSIDDPDPKSFAPGFKSSPLVTHNSVYLGDEDGIFHCLNRETGERRWSYETQGEIISSATLISDRVIFGSYDNNLYCLNAESGEKIWNFETEGYVNCTPAVINGYTFVTGCDEQLRVIDVQTGQQIKQMPLQTYMIASPAIVGDFLYVGTYASEVLAVNWKLLNTEWKYRSTVAEFPYHSSAAVTDKYIVVGGRDKQVHCITRLTGKEVWTYATRGKVDSSPVVVGDRVFVGSDDGHLYGFDLTSGKELYKEKLGRSISASPAIAEKVLVIGTSEAGGKLYCLGQKNP